MAGQELCGDPWKPSMCIPPTTKLMCVWFITLLCESVHNFEGWSCVASGCSRHFDCDLGWFGLKDVTLKINYCVLLKQSVSVTKKIYILIRIDSRCWTTHYFSVIRHALTLSMKHQSWFFSGPLMYYTISAPNNRWLLVSNSNLWLSTRSETVASCIEKYRSSSFCRWWMKSVCFLEIAIRNQAILKLEKKCRYTLSNWSNLTAAILNSKRNSRPQKQDFFTNKSQLCQWQVRNLTVNCLEMKWKLNDTFP